MLSYQQLVTFDPETLRTAAGQWRTVATALSDQHTAIRTGVGERLTAPVWEGAAATAARGHVAALGTDTEDMAAAFELVHTTLTAAADVLGASRDEVLALTADARQLGLRVGPDGTVTVPAATVPDGPEHTARQAAMTNLAAVYTAEISAALRDASEVDDTTAALLAGDDETATARFAQTTEPGVDAVADAERAAELAGSGWLWIEDVDELNALFTAHAGDPEFAATFFDELGPAGTYAFLGRLSGLGLSEYDPGSELGTQIGATQRQLGAMLALATDPGSEPTLGNGWTEQLLAEGTATVESGIVAPTGLQLLGTLLQNDDVVFPTDFLTRYGDAVMAQDELGWPTDTHLLGFVDETSTGWDPVTALLSALGNNGEAATAFFDPQAHPGRIEYLLEDRVLVSFDVPDDAYNTDADDGPYFDELGNALHSATTADVDDTGAHSASQAGIMTETVRVLGSPDHRNGDVPDGMRDSVGEMFAEYIADVNHAVERGGSLRLDADGDPEALSYEWAGLDGPGTNDPLFAAESHALFAVDDLGRVLGDTARDADAYAHIYEAERAYAAVTLDMAASTADLGLQERANAVEAEARTAATVLGLLDEARADEVQEHGEAADEAYNNAVDSIGGATSWGLGKAADLAGDNLLGKTIGGVSTVLDWVLGQADRDSSEQIAIDTAEVYTDGRWQAANLAFQAMWNNQIWPPEYPPPAILMPDGHPIDLTTMNDEQWAALEGWIATSPGYDVYMNLTLQGVDSSYSVGGDHENESDGDRVDD